MSHVSWLYHIVRYPAIPNPSCWKLKNVFRTCISHFSIYHLHFTTLHVCCMEIRTDLRIELSKNIKMQVLTLTVGGAYKTAEILRLQWLPRYTNQLNSFQTTIFVFALLFIKQMTWSLFQYFFTHIHFCILIWTKTYQLRKEITLLLLLLILFSIVIFITRWQMFLLYQSINLTKCWCISLKMMVKLNLF